MRRLAMSAGADGGPASIIHPSIVHYANPRGCATMRRRPSSAGIALRRQNRGVSPVISTFVEPIC